MAESPRRVDLRLTIPAKAPFHELALDVAAKFAEYAGMSSQRIAAVHAAVQAALTDTGDDIDIEMTTRDGELIVTTNPSHRRTAFPLSD